MTRSTISDVSTGMNLEGHVAFFREQYGLDPTAALLVFKADTFVVQDQLKKALQYYRMVLNDYPRCPYTIQNANAVATLLETEMREKPAGSKKQSLQNAVFTITSMSVEWEAIEYPYYTGDGPDFRQIAIDLAKKELLEKGFPNSLLQLTGNEILSSQTVDDMSVRHTGCAHFQVTLIPGRLEAESPDVISDRTVKPWVATGADSIPASISHLTCVSAAGSSRFADATYI